MANRKLVRILNQILTTASDDRGVSDAELLQRFACHGDAGAFELLVWRYQWLVLGICRRVLNDVHDAEDAFHGTFLILARKASSVTRRAAIGSWLHQVATHVAVRARQSLQAVRERSLDGVDAAASGDGSDLERQELWSVVDEEVNRLPPRLQAAVVRCYFEGKTIAEASQILRCPQGTVASRLARAKERLRLRLTERGMVFSSGVLAAGLSQTGLAGAAAEGVVRRTGQAVAALVSRAVTRSVSGKVVALSKEVLSPDYS
jgi:RNA polymerase sigma factor (sigma-70 family)